MAHEAVTRDLGDDRGSCDRCAGGVAVDDRARRPLEPRHREAVQQARNLTRDTARDGAERVAQCGEIGLVQAALVNPAHAAADDGDPCRAAQHEREELIASLAGVLLGVVERAQRPHLARADRLVVEHHGSRHQRPGQASAAGLVGAGDEPHAKPAVKREQPPPAGGAPAAPPAPGR